MGVNSESNQHVKESALTFPCLMITGDPDIVVLFREKKRGVIVHAEKGAGYKVGYVSTSWDMPSFKPFTGSITLSNE
jgi:hypothetical protein